ncbi:MAG TPA: hypothetical protein VNB52_09995 [Ilumatobacteraceae bacterium]|nr:hypothetical protein [Ilumatobacteraceae bacterium]
MATQTLPPTASTNCMLDVRGAAARLGVTDRFVRRRAERVLVTRGSQLVADIPSAWGQEIDIDVPDGRDVVLTIIGHDGRALRRALTSISGSPAQLGEIELSQAEFVPGIA